MLKPVAHEPALTDRVRDALLEAIAAGTLRSGERLSQEQIAQRLGVSRQPVSHALNVLKEQGILVELGRKGLTVAPLAAGHVRQLYQVRGALDALAARLAAERVRHDEVPGRDLQALRELVARHLAGTGKRSVAELVEADVRFHVALYALSGNPVLEEMARPHWVHFRRSMRAVLDAPHSRDAIWPEHQEIIDAVEAGDPQRAARLAERHTRRAGEATAVRLAAQPDSEENHP